RKAERRRRRTGAERDGSAWRGPAPLVRGRRRGLTASRARRGSRSCWWRCDKSSCQRGYKGAGRRGRRTRRGWGPRGWGGSRGGGEEGEGDAVGGVDVDAGEEAGAGGSDEETVAGDGEAVDAAAVAEVLQDAGAGDVAVGVEAEGEQRGALKAVVGDVEGLAVG